MKNRSGSVQLASICQPRRAAVPERSPVVAGVLAAGPVRVEATPLGRPEAGRDRVGIAGGAATAVIASAPTAGPPGAPCARGSGASSGRRRGRRTVIATRISASTSGGRRADRERRRRRTPAGASRRGRPRAGSCARASAPRNPSRATGKLRPDTKYTGSMQQLGQVERLAAPHQEQAGEHHPQAVQRGEREREDRQQQEPLVDGELHAVERRRR